jgi:hypothetical protein
VPVCVRSHLVSRSRSQQGGALGAAVGVGSGRGRCCRGLGLARVNSLALSMASTFSVAATAAPFLILLAPLCWFSCALLLVCKSVFAIAFSLPHSSGLDLFVFTVFCAV